MLDKNNIPKHIAIIMDGNGRWAKQKGLPRTSGHREGVARVKEIVRSAAQLGVKVVTFFAFSNENWVRPKNEVSILMRYLDNFLDREIRELEKNNIRFLTIGRKDPIPKYLQEKLESAKERTQNNTGLTVVLAFNYGGRQEIVDAVKKFCLKVERGEEKSEDLNEDIFNSYLYTAGLPDPDLLIRTSAQMRISNFLLWQLSYAELYFPKKYWPDFKAHDLEKAIEVYQKRERRFGGI
ncbi:MAG: isoprenyl transferase [Candidatus Omnitrophica bacterium]|nr:isoprenyl transferase [Candidatus Omnitrophota bacterium]